MRPTRTAEPAQPSTHLRTVLCTDCARCYALHCTAVLQVSGSTRMQCTALKGRPQAVDRGMDPAEPETRSRRSLKPTVEIPRTVIASAAELAALALSFDRPVRSR